jgi:hypothetical protein
MSKPYSMQFDLIIRCATSARTADLPAPLPERVAVAMAASDTERDTEVDTEDEIMMAAEDPERGRVERWSSEVVSRAGT